MSATQPATKLELQEYCLRKLGKPTIEINIAQTQMDDLIDDALQLAFEYHSDWSKRCYYNHLITQDDVDNQYLTIPDDVLRVVRIFPIDIYNLSDYQYVVQMYNLYGFFNSDLTTYYMTQSYLNFVQKILKPEFAINFSRFENRITVDTNWRTNFVVGSYVVFETYNKIDNTTNSKAYNDMWFKKYCTQIFKRQWGENLKKYGGVALPGGITLNGKEIWDEAVQEIDKLIEDLEERYVEPAQFFVG